MSRGRLSWNGVFLLLVTVPALAQLRPGTPASVGISRAGLDRATLLLESAVRQGCVGAASILVARRGTIVLHKGFGHLSSEAGSPAVEADSIYIVASITKPVTATALMLLVERGQVSLNEPVSTYLPEFTGGERSKVRVANLLTHTSGLPDQLPENVDLRRAHAPLSEFLKHTFATPLLFTPGTAWHYQSMGILLAAEIVARVAGMPVADFERQEIFGPLGMRHSSLGMGGRRISDTVQVMAPGNTDPRPPTPEDFASWGANSEYWRNIGCPWGGMHATTMDLAIFLQTFLDGGTYSGKRLLSPASVKAMTSDQNGRLNAPWGLGWRLGASSGKDLGDLVSPRAFGHTGSSGTCEWADPETQVICVILTNHPLGLDKGLLLRRVSNAVAASVEK
jgi:CubicO group peptidase (beta-lactamase class C family)